MAELIKRNIVIFVYSALILSTLLVFWQVRNFDFVNYDDQIYVYQNLHVSNGLTPSGVIWAFTSCYKGYWQPLTWLSLMVDCQLFGPSPGSIHLVNVLLHIANTLLLFWVLKKMTGAFWSSAFVAALFALHPMHVESVAWIAERKDVLSTFFLLLTLAAYTGYTKSPTIYRYMVSLVLFAFGIMAKPMLVTLPFLLLLLDYWPLNRFTAEHAETAEKKNKMNSACSAVFAVRLPGWLIVEKIPFLVLSVVSSIITFVTQNVGTIIYDTKNVPLMDKAGNAFLSYSKYIAKLFWPRNLAVLYPFDVGSFVFWQVVMSIVLLIVISVLVIRFGRNRKYLPVGWFWFIGMLIPVIGLVKFTWSSYADRFTYIPYIGLFIMLAWGLPGLLSGWRYRKIVLGTAASMTLIALGTVAERQVGVWKNSITLFSHAIAVTHNNALVHNYLGMTYLDLKRYQDAIESFNQAIRIDRNCTEAYYNLGVVFDKVGRLDDAIDNFKQVIQARPHYAEAHYNLGNAYLSLGRYQDALEIYKRAVMLDPALVEAHYNLGNAYSKLGLYQEAAEAFKQAIKIKPDYTEAYNNLGNAYVGLGRVQEGAEAFKQAININPDFADAYNNLGNACLGLGRLQDAIEKYKQAIRIKPNWAEAYFNLGAAYGSIGSTQEEIDSYKQAIKIKPDFADAYYNLGLACGVLGRYQESIDSFEKAISIKPDWGEAHFNLGVTYLMAGDKASALEEYRILKTLGAGQADQLYNLIHK